MEAGVDFGMADVGTDSWPDVNLSEASFVSALASGTLISGGWRVSGFRFGAGVVGWILGFDGEAERGLTSMGETSPSGRCCVMTMSRARF